MASALITGPRLKTIPGLPCQSGTKRRTRRSTCAPHSKAWPATGTRSVAARIASSFTQPAVRGAVAVQRDRQSLIYGVSEQLAYALVAQA